MKLKIGKIYRYSNQNRSEDIEEVDGLPNYFYYTKVKNFDSTFTFQKGIHSVKVINTSDGKSRCPVIIVSSSPHKAGSEYTPWKDYYDTDHGYIKYYGDNKDGNSIPSDKVGNKELLKLLPKFQSEDSDIRKNEAVPIVFFERVNYDNRAKGNLKFQGFGVLDSAKLITQANKGEEFSNYLFEFAIFSMVNENEEFDWDWIAKRCDSNLTTEETNKYAPKAWKDWVKTGNIELSRRNVAKLDIVKAIDQIPNKNSKEEIILNKVKEFYENKKHTFEILAMECTKFFLDESSVRYTDGWITKKSGDGGIDFVLKMNIGNGFEGLDIVLLGQAKCEKNATSGKDIARTVARLKRGWVGAYVTTSYFSDPVQLEILEDKYPLIKINGLKLAELIDRNVLGGSNDYKKLENYLEQLEIEYNTKISSRNLEMI